MTVTTDFASTPAVAPTLPSTPREAVCYLEAAALYLRECYFDSECRRNEGWGYHEGPRLAFEIMRNRSAQLATEKEG